MSTALTWGDSVIFPDVNEIIRAAYRELCLKDFHIFLRQMNPNFADTMPEFHKKIARDIQDWAESEEPYGLILSLPPGHGKSWLCKHALAWLIARDPSLKIAYASYAQTLADTQLAELYSILDSERYIELFGRKLNDRRVVTDTSKGAKRTQNMAEILGATGCLRSIGRGGGLTGVRLDVGVVDDLFKDAAEARSPAVIRECREWFTRVLSTRDTPGRPYRLMILNTRWSTDDLTGWLLSPDSGLQDNWIEVKFPALKEDEPSESDLREPGEALWPIVCDVNKLLSKRKSDPEGFAALYQQSPVIEGGNLFKQDWFVKRWRELPTREGTWLQSWDLRGGGNQSRGSFAVGQLWFKAHQSSDFYLIDQVRGRWSPTETYDIILSKNTDPLWSKARIKLIEKKADGIGALDYLRDKISGLTPVMPTSDKETRARSTTPYWASLNVILPHDIDEYPWLNSYISEHLSFPACANDDQVDASSQALIYFSENVSISRPVLLRQPSNNSNLNRY